MVWASMTPASVGTGRMPVILGTYLSLGSIRTSVVSVVVRAPPVHLGPASAAGRQPMPLWDWDVDRVAVDSSQVLPLP